MEVIRQLTRLRGLLLRRSRPRETCASTRRAHALQFTNIFPTESGDDAVASGEHPVHIWKNFLAINVAKSPHRRHRARRYIGNSALVPIVCLGAQALPAARQRSTSQPRPFCQPPMLAPLSRVSGAFFFNCEKPQFDGQRRGSPRHWLRSGKPLDTERVSVRMNRLLSASKCFPSSAASFMRFVAHS
jgi:hypothetical protein